MSTEDGDPAGPTAETGSVADSSGDDLVRAVLGTTRRPPPTSLLPGEVLDDTYKIVRILGVGGMGTVYLARDQKLGRAVAIKLHSTNATPRGVERLIREASAIAQLTHPNVVTVYQVDRYQGHPFVAMEYVDGGTARAWRAAEPRTWREIVGLYIAAGRGLAAAHRAGLVHRDFKPDNVLVGNDGRVRVADFGLVQGVVPSDSGGDDGEETIEDDDGRLTRSGVVMGTPAYMAPEQHRAEEVGAAADQFAFCVALWEALTGARPFAGAKREQVLDAIVAGKLREPPAQPHLRRVLARGLAADPAARFPTMDALLAALAWDPAVRRRRIAIASIAALVLAGGGLTAYALTREDPEARCRAGATLTGTWDAPRRAAVEQAFLATSKPHAADTFERTAGHLDDYGAAWVTARLDACRATHVRDQQSTALRDVRYACLDHRRAELRALVDLFAAGPDPKLLDTAIDASRDLEDLDACDDVTALAGAPALPTDRATRAEITRLEGEVARADALITAGRFADAVGIATPATEAARTTGYAPLLASALRSLGGAQNGAGDHVHAKATMLEATHASAEAHDDVGVVSSWMYLLHLLVTDSQELDEAEHLVPVVEAAVARAGASPRLRVQLDSNVGLLRAAQGRYDDARIALERALATAERELPDDRATLTAVLNRLASTLTKQGSLQAARGYLERTIKLQEEELGPEHPYIAMSLHNLGGVIIRMGDYEGALAIYQRSLAMKEKLLGPDHRDLVNTLSHLGVALRNLGRYEEARPYLERSVKIAEATYGDGHPSLALALINLAGVIAQLGSYDEALPMFERGLKMYETKMGKNDPALVDTLIELGGIRAAMGDSTGGRADLERAEQIITDTVGPRHPDMAAALASLADILVGEGKLHEALAQYERARSITVEALGEDHPQVAKIDVAMGFLELQSNDLEAARKHFTTAQAGFAKVLGPEHPEVARCQFGLAEIDLRAGSPVDAQDRLEQVIAILEKGSGPDHPSLADPLTSLARAHLYQGHAKEALAAAERAIKVQAGHAGDPRSIAETEFVLAQAHWLEGSDRKAALVEARKAREALAAAKVSPSDLAEFDRWLKHPAE